MTRWTPQRAERSRVALLVTGGLLALVIAAGAGRPAALSVDERDYLAAAANLRRFGVLSFAPPSPAAPAPDAYREPGYPALLAATWGVAGVAAPASPAELERFAAEGPAARAARGLHVAGLALAALATGWAARRLATPTAGALAFALVAASPALHQAARLYAVEGPAAALVALAAAALVAAAEGGTVPRALLAALVVGALPLVLAAAIVVVPAGALALLYADWVRPPRKRPVRALLFLVVALLPALLWAERNRRELGHRVLSGRGGVALAVRAELDAEVARSGALAAALAWTPFEPARRLGEARAPEAHFDQPRWGEATSYFSRAMARWRAGGGDDDPLAREAELRRASLDAFRAQPFAHLAATAAVAWRGLFAERTPEWIHPFEARLPIGLLLAACSLRLAATAVREGGARRAALLLPAAGLFAFLAVATELLPRYAEPLLPVAWTAVALAVTGTGAPRRPGSTATTRTVPHGRRG